MAPAAANSTAATAEPAVAEPKSKTMPTVINRLDYKAPPYLVDQVNLNFVLQDDVTTVESVFAIKPNHTGATPPPLQLQGHPDVKLVSVEVNGTDVPSSGYQVTPTSLTLTAPPVGSYELRIVVNIKPQENTALEGLYKSGGNYCTQCEAQGFRHITYFLDRPDVMAKYTTRIEADRDSYPVLLGNGNLVDQGGLDNGRHFAVWEDPWPKPCYLFALVAGALEVKEDTFTTASGRTVALRIFTTKKNINKVDFAIESLKKSMKWDEDVFGLEYDLDLFNIVAVDDFNMGAMENKSLNIFNSRLVLADSDTATDMDFERIEGVVGHEYFHNWTGNRVTCRDWFQLTLKEGLTVYRDQEFSADMNSRPVKRIDDVGMLRSRQFAEDAGPMAHPVRPDSYMAIDNFYTVTVYEKGAEVVRLYETLLGKQGFRKGMDLYFQRHDGQAVTCDDFLAAMADANSADLGSLARWYSTAGTPTVTVRGEFDPSARTYTLTATQCIANSPDAAPLLVPIATALLAADGKPLALRVDGEELGTCTVLRLELATQQWVFTDIDTAPVPSLLRGFSAPIKLVVEGQRDEDLTFLMANDTDPFNRWESGQRLARKILLQLYEHAQSASADADSVAEACTAAGGVPDGFVEAVKALLTDPQLDGSFKAMAITPPSLTELVDAVDNANPVLLHHVRSYLVKQLATRLRVQLEEIVTANDAAPGESYVFDAAACAKRAIKNRALGFLSTLNEPAITQQLLNRVRGATNMTDRMAALAALNDVPSDARDTALAEFYEQYKDEPLVVLKWLALVTSSNVPGNLAAVQKMMEHPAFVITNPNCCYSTFLTFARSAVNFHAADGSGYAFLADAVLKVDKLNPQVASRIVRAFDSWKQYDGQRQQLMQSELQRVLAQEGLSANVYEIASKSAAF